MKNTQKWRKKPEIAPEVSKNDSLPPNYINIQYGTDSNQMSFKKTKYCPLPPYSDVLDAASLICKVWTLSQRFFFPGLRGAAPAPRNRPGKKNIVWEIFSSGAEPRKTLAPEAPREKKTLGRSTGGKVIQHPR